LINTLIKYKYFFLFIALFAIHTTYKTIDTYSLPTQSKEIQSKILELEQKSNGVISLYEKEINDKGLNRLWESKPFHDKTFNVHIYRNDSLLFWNTNRLPLNRFADNLHFPITGIIKNQNGWYYAKTIEKKGIKICCSFLVKNEYSYQNEDLINSFSEEFESYNDIKIVVDQEKPNKIYNKNKEYLFSVVSKEKPSDIKANVFSFSIVLAAICFLLMGIYQASRSIPLKWAWPIPVLLFGIRIILMGNESKLFGFSPLIISNKKSIVSHLNPDIGAYILNVILIVVLVVAIVGVIKKIRTSSFKSVIILIILLVFSYVLWSLALLLFSHVVLGSDVPFLVDHLFELNYFSLFIIGSVALLFFSFYYIVREIIDSPLLSEVNRNVTALLVFLIGAIYVLIGIFAFEEDIVSLITPLIVGLWVVFSLKTNEIFGSKSVSILFILFLCSFFVSVKLQSLNEIKSNNERASLATYLATEKQEETEKQYAKISSKLEEDSFIKKLIKGHSNISLTDFEYMMEGRYFKDYWESYEMNFNLFDSSGVSFFTKDDSEFKEFNLLVKNNSEKSKYNESIYYVKDYKGQLSYVIKQKIKGENNTHAFFTATLKSKKIPEGIGFPRLLISSKTPVLEYLEKYSIAKYHRGKLVSKYGRYSFPSTPIALSKDTEEGEIEKEGYNHYILKKGKDNVVIISKKESNVLEIITRFSYLFVFFGLILFLSSFFKGVKSVMNKTVTLSIRIQIVLVLLVFSSLFAFGWGSGVFVRNQYKKHTSDNIREKLVSLEIELRAKLGAYDALSIDNDGNYMGYVLSKLSRVFVTDINLYDPEGHLLASSRPKVFNKGLMGEQINPTAYHMLRVKQKSDFSQKESIGELDYTSAYLPFYNSKGELLAYVNLQHFGQQKELENQIQEFLVAIINVFILLLVISVVISVFVSNWVTKPLRLLHENISSIHFGQGNQKITYDKKDEIGALVKQYNQKLEELATTADQLAKSERESAWRDMAKQVAHEIKNPLTPMKLSIQQLVRVFDKEDPSSHQKLEKVAQSLIEQIEGLSKIANEFSNFAKMPVPEKKEIDLVELIQSNISIFEQKDLVDFELKTICDKATVFADKDQIIRVLNNLIKNAVQSIPKERLGKIEISLQKELNEFLIVIKDNGRGISEKQKSKIFIPYFTTKSTGTGIGLPIAKQIIENHEGKIVFESTLNEGTSVFVFLPQINTKSDY